MNEWRDLCSSWWLDKADRLEAEWADGIPHNWFANRIVWDCGLFAMNTTVAAAQSAEVSFIEAAGPAPTPTDVNHLFHLHTADPNLPVRIDATVVEWGGGFGNTARIVNNLGIDHVIIDIPIMRELQTHYLTGHRMDRCSLSHSEAATVTGDVFLAAYSLDECSEAAHDYVFDLDWFGASTILIAAEVEGKDDMFPDGPVLVRRLRAAGFDETPTMSPGSSYFRLQR